jgi:hypothetical protein
MVVKIKRQDCLDLYQAFPLRSYNYQKDEEEIYFPEVYKSHILTVPSKSFKGQVKVLATELIKFAKHLHTETFIFLGDTELPWLYQTIDYKPAREAQAYLKYIKVGKRFNGALQVDTSELPTFLRHLAWLTRCSAALPYFHFTDERQNIVGSICQYGNLHLNTLNVESDTLLNSFVKNSNFEFTDRNSCNNSFGKTSAISGRKTVM